MKGMMALALHRSSETKLAKQLIEALRQNAVTTNEEMGMYWKMKAVIGGIKPQSKRRLC